MVIIQHWFRTSSAGTNSAALISLKTSVKTITCRRIRTMTAASGQFRMMHTMIRVLDLDRSIKFYTELLGMKLLRRDDYPGGKFTNAFVGYGPEETDTVVELTYNWGRE